MAYYVYLKADPKVNSASQEGKNFPWFPLTLIGAGVLILSIVVLPLLVWKFSSGANLSQNKVLGQEISEVSIKKDDEGFSYFVPASTYKPRSLADFRISVAKLGIENAKVVVDGLDFKKNLAHYPQTALPGEIGNVFVTGHSSLPAISNPNDYNSIFSELSSLDVGDTIEADVSGIVYRYEVIKMIAVDPSDVSILRPPDGVGRYLTLMTCIPPGLNSQRLAVLAKLIDNPLESESF